MSANPLLNNHGVPAFEIIRTEHIEPAVEVMLAQAEADFEALLKQHTPTWEGLIEPLDRIELAMQETWGPVGHLHGVKNSDALRAVYEKMLPKLVAADLKFSQDRTIFAALKQLRSSSAWKSLRPVQQRCVQKRIRDAELAGVGLEGEKKARFNQIAERLSHCQTRFSNHVLDATKAFSLILRTPEDAAGLPQHALELAAQSYNQAHPNQATATPDQGPWRITLDFPSFGPFMQYCQNRAHRETVYKAYINRASEGEINNQELIFEILRLRQEKAELLGFENYAALSLASKMANQTQDIYDLLTQLQQAALPKSRVEL
ncbi:MAG: M3 family metallopeptidase, partial [Myxococcota bacterium]